MRSDWGSDCMRICKTVYLHSHHVCLSKCLSVSQSPCPCAWFCVRAGQRKEWKWKKKKGAVSQCCLSRELMGAGGRALGRPEPCTIQASFRRSTTTGAKHHTVLGNTRTCKFGKTMRIDQNFPQLLQLFTTNHSWSCLFSVHSKSAGSASVSLPIEVECNRLAQFSFGMRSARMWNSQPSTGSSKNGLENVARWSKRTSRILHNLNLWLKWLINLILSGEGIVLTQVGKNKLSFPTTVWKALCVKP